MKLEEIYQSVIDGDAKGTEAGVRAALGQEFDRVELLCHFERSEKSRSVQNRMSQCINRLSK